jgi:release factor glutamine methyltransferase
MNLREAITLASNRIALRDAETLAAHILACDRAWLLAHPEHELTPDHQTHLEILITRRAAAEPLQYILGSVEFYGLRLRVTPDVLIPRPETEVLVEQVLLWAASQPVDDLAGPDAARMRFADVGTGSGAIAIALATHLAAAVVTALDLSPAALELAWQNARDHDCSTRIRFLESDLLSAVAAEQAADRHFPRLDAVVSNPPYVPDTDAPTMQHEVVRHEPHLALFSGADGLDAIRRLIPQSQSVLRAKGLLAFEFGYGQRDAIAQLLTDWHNVRFIDDYAGIPRIVLATRP